MRTGHERATVLINAAVGRALAWVVFTPVAGQAVI
jgi:hypothetical protein